MTELTELSSATLLRSHVNRRLSVQNSQLSNNCEGLRKNFEKMQFCNQNKIENDKSELYRYQEKLHVTTGNFVSSENSARTTPELIPLTRQRRLSIAASIFTEVSKLNDEPEQEKPAQEQPSRSRSFSDQSFKKDTLSSQHKRLTRRKSCISLLELQKFNANIKDTGRQKTSREAFTEEPVEEWERFMQDNEEPVKIPPAVHLPPIHTQVVTQLKERKFEKDREFKRKISGQGQDEDELKYCRYLRRPRGLRRRVKSDFRRAQQQQRR